MRNSGMLVSGLLIVLFAVFTVPAANAQPEEEDPMAQVYEMIADSAEVDIDTVEITLSWIRANQDDLEERFGENIDDESITEYAEYVAENAGVETEDVIAIVEALKSMEG